MNLSAGNMYVIFSVDNFKIINVECLMCSSYKLRAMEVSLCSSQVLGKTRVFSNNMWYYSVQNLAFKSCGCLLL